jgi:hypothetical protein
MLSIAHAHALERTGTRAGFEVAGGVKAVGIYRGGVSAGAGDRGDERPNYGGFIATCDAMFRRV